MATSAGKVTIIPRGEWNATASYTRLDAVVVNGSSYIAKKDNVNTPVTNTEYWQLLAQSGNNATAAQISYSNTTSGLTSTTAQGAIDELASRNTVVDTQMSDTSTHAVQNKTIKGYVDTEVGKKANTSHTHVVADITDLAYDSAINDTSTNAVQNKVIKAYVDNSKASKATSTTLGTVMPDGTTTSVDTDGKLSVSSAISGHSSASIVSTTGVHDLRYNTTDEKLQAKVNGSWVDCGGGGSSGSVISGTTTDSSLYGKTVSCSYNGSVIKTATISALGTFTLEGIQPLGELTISASNGTDTAEEKVNATVWSYYEVKLSLYTLYGFHINASESDPDARVTYLDDCKNASYDSAYMDFTTNTFNWGSWSQDEFFMPRSCMLKSNGVVDYYLDENDHTKKADGTASDVANTSYDGNAMMEWGRDGKIIYWKIVPDTNTDGGKVYICDKKLDSGFKDFNFRDANGKLISHFYTPKYNGSLVGSKLRSLSGQTPIQSKTATQEVSYAQANNPSGKQMWYIEQYCDWTLINLLLVLMCKSTNTQNKFGYGNIYYNPTSASAMINSGTMNSKGMFWGKNSSTTHDGVKVFGMENYWANQWRRLAGYINVSGTQKFKLTWDTTDGSTTTGYNETGSGYIASSGTTPSGTNGGYINKAKFDATLGIVPYTASGSETTYFADGFWFNKSQTSFAVVSGTVSLTFPCGAFCANVNYSLSDAGWNVGASVSCKPLG